MKQLICSSMLWLLIGSFSCGFAEALKPPAPKAPMAKKLAPVIQIPSVKVFNKLSDVYKPVPGQHILLVMHLPPESGEAFLEVFNHTQSELSLLQFSLSTMGMDGELEYEDLPPGWSAVKIVKLTSLRELLIRNAHAFDKNADEVAPRLVIYQTQLGSNKPQLGTHKAK